MNNQCQAKALYYNFRITVYKITFKLPSCSKTVATHFLQGILARHATIGDKRLYSEMIIFHSFTLLLN